MTLQVWSRIVWLAVGLLAAVWLAAIGAHQPAAAGEVRAAQSTLLSEDFEDIDALEGWQAINKSDPQPGENRNWGAGNPAVFPAHIGAGESYLASSVLSVDSSTQNGTLSNWLLTPVLYLSDGDRLLFWTRTISGTQYPDRLDVRISVMGSSSNVGDTADAVGDFTTLLASINQNVIVSGYPEAWTAYELTINGIGYNQTGRIAFHHYVEDAGSGDNSNGNYIGLDTVQYTSTITRTYLPFGFGVPLPAALEIINQTDGTIIATLEGVSTLEVPSGTTAMWDDIPYGTYIYTVRVEGGSCSGQGTTTTLKLAPGETQPITYTCTASSSTTRLPHALHAEQLATRS